MKRNILLPAEVNDLNPIMSQSQTVGWGLLKLRIKKLHQRGIKGKGVRIAVLDTGIVQNHEDLKIKKHRNFTDSTSAYDGIGHGTHVAGIIAAQGNEYGVLGLAPEAEIYSYKVLDKGPGAFKPIARAIYQAAHDGIDIINMSLGSHYSSPNIERACAYAREKGIIIVASSGNSGRDERFYPASYDTVIATGSVDKDLTRSPFSTYGKQLDVMAPGHKILSTYLNNRYAVMSGTSMASPFCSGAIALMLQAGVKRDYKEIISHTFDIMNPGFDEQSGWGMIDPNSFIKSINDPDRKDKEELLAIIKNIEIKLKTLKNKINE